MVYDPARGMVKPGDRQPAWIEEEMKDGDRICEAAGVQRTDGGRLPVAKIINKLKAASATNDADAKDAARYRYLQRRSCGNATGGKGSDEECYLSLNPRDLDAAIDSHLEDEARRKAAVDSRFPSGGTDA